MFLTLSCFFLLFHTCSYFLMCFFPFYYFLLFFYFFILVYAFSSFLLPCILCMTPLHLPQESNIFKILPMTLECILNLQLRLDIVILFNDILLHNVIKAKKKNINVYDYKVQLAFSTKKKKEKEK